MGVVVPCFWKLHGSQGIWCHTSALSPRRISSLVLCLSSSYDRYFWDRIRHIPHVVARGLGPIVRMYIFQDLVVAEATILQETLHLLLKLLIFDRHSEINLQKNVIRHYNGFSFLQLM